MRLPPSTLRGAVLWLVTPFVPIGSPPAFGAIEHLFVLMPLVLAPLALVLVTSLAGCVAPRGARLRRWAGRIQPLASAMVLASFFVRSGTLAGALTVGWLVMAVLTAVGGARGAARAGSRHGTSVRLLAAHLFLPIGAAWLLLSRLGVAPADLATPTVFLAALHFHFSGFTLQILIAAAGVRLPSRGWPGALHRAVSVVAAAGIPLIAAGNIGHAPLLKWMGVMAMVASTLAMAVTSTAVARGLSDRAARRMLLVSAGAIAAGMVLAGVHGAGEITGRSWIGASRMATVHGLLNGVGFTLFGLLGHLRLGSRGGRTSHEGPLVAGPPWIVTGRGAGR